MHFEKFRAALAEFRKQGYTDFGVMVSGERLVLKLTGKHPSGSEIELMTLYRPKGDTLSKLVKTRREAGLFRHWIEADRVYRDKGK